MLAVKHERGIEAFSMEDREFEDENLLGAINFDDILIGIGDGDVLPDLEIDSEFFAEFSGSESETKLEIENNSREDAAVSDVDLESAQKPEPEVKDPDLKKADDDTSKVSSSRCKNPSGKKKTKVLLNVAESLLNCVAIDKLMLILSVATGGLDAGIAPAVRAGGGAARD